MTDASFTPEWFSKPGDTVIALMEKRGVSSSEIVARTGWSRETLRGVLGGAVAIDDDIAAKLSEVVGGSSDFWKRRQVQFDRDLLAASKRVPRSEASDWIKSLPVKQMREEGWLPGTTNYDDVLRASLAFFDVSGPEEWQLRYTQFANEFRFRTSATFDSTVGALSAWLRQGELEAATEDSAAWDAEGFKEQLFELRSLSRSKQPHNFIPKLRHACAATGVAVVFVKSPPGCRASGASRFVSDERAMMILSFRHLSDDHFWFSFFHEAAHLLLHGTDKTFVDGDLADDTEEEAEANAFAAGMLIPNDRLEEMLELRARMEDIVRFAQRIGVSPGVVVGQMQHHNVIGPQQMNGLKRRFTWDQITDAIA